MTVADRDRDERDVRALAEEGLIAYYRRVNGMTLEQARAFLARPEVQAYIREDVARSMAALGHEVAS